MMDYSKLSDLEINKRVARYCLGGRSFGVVDGRVETFGGTFDPCNNPAEAWRIIVGSRISLSPFDDFKEGGDYIAAKYKPTRDNSKPAEVEFFCCDKPLRAAMIVFLMMQEGE